MVHEIPSPTWCPAPWHGCVVNGDGTTAVCPIGPRVALGKDGSFDNAQLARIKTSMLNGERLRECDKCWFHERNGIKSLRQSYLEIWRPNIDYSMVRDPSYDQRFYFDLSLSNKCNQKCRICGPFNSTGWFKDAEELDDLTWTHVHGPRRVQSSDDLVDTVLAMMSRSQAPLEIELKGGEPLYLEESRRLLQAIVDMGLNEKTDILKVLTNGTITDDAILDLLKRFPSIDLSISIDAVGKLHEYTRGSSISWDGCRKSWHRLAALPNIRFLGIANTIYIYNIFDQVRLYEWARSDLGITNEMSNAILTKPTYLNVKIMPDDLKLRALDALAAHPMRHRLDGLANLLQQEITDLDVLPGWSNKQSASISEISLRLSRLRNKFKLFTNALDGIRGESVLSLVPELSPMMA